MSKQDVLTALEFQVSRWDCGISERAREFCTERLAEAQRASSMIDLDALVLPCEDLAGMALSCLHSFTNYTPDYFESISDCCHAISGIAAHTAAPDYVKGLLEVRCSCLTILNHVEDAREFDRPGHTACAIEELDILSGRLAALDSIVESRHRLEIDLLEVLKAERTAQARASNAYRAKMAKARSERAPVHDWEAVAKLEDDLLRAGKSPRSVAGIVEMRLGIPKTTYRDWRRRKTTT